MKRVIVSAAVVGGVLLSSAPPATAAPPDRFTQSGAFASLQSFSFECTPEVDGRRTCTNVFLEVHDRPDGVDTLLLSISRIVEENGNMVEFVSEDGFLEADLDFTVSDEITATLAPTEVALQSCDDSGNCQSREVTVSASDSADGDVTTFRSRERFRDGTCTYTNAVQGTTASVVGTITVDGTTYEESGFASQGSVRSTRKC